MSSSFLRALGAALFLFACAHAAAADEWYGEFHVGTTRSSHQDPTFTGADRVEGAYGIGAGAVFNEYFSTQFDWHTLGELPDQSPPACPIPPCPITLVFIIPEHGYVLRALPRLPLGESFALELGIGWMKWEGDLTTSGVRFSDSGTDPLYSLAASWRFGERWSATVEYQQLQHDYLDFDWTGATLRYRF